MQGRKIKPSRHNNFELYCIPYSIKYSYAGIENIRGKTIWIWIGKTAFFPANLPIYLLWTGTPRKFVDLRFAEWAQEFADLQKCDLRGCGKFACPPLTVRYTYINMHYTLYVHMNTKILWILCDDNCKIINSHFYPLLTVGCQHKQACTIHYAWGKIPKIKKGGRSHFSFLIAKSVKSFQELQKQRLFE